MLNCIQQYDFGSIVNASIKIKEQRVVREKDPMISITSSSFIEIEKQRTKKI